MFQVQKLVFRSPNLINFQRQLSLKTSKRPVIFKQTHSDRIGEVIDNFGEISSKDWPQVKTKLFEKSSFINDKNFDALILQYCTATEKFELAEQFCEYLQNQGKDLSLGALGKYFRLYYFMKDCNYNPVLTEKHIFDLYDNFRKKYNVIDSVTGENAICALSVTSRWKDCLKLIEEIKLTQIPNTEVYSYTANAAFCNNEYDLGFSLLDEAFFNNRTPQINTYIKYLNFIKNSKDTLNEKLNKLERLFYFFEAHDILTNELISKKILETTKSLNLVAKEAIITSKGDCSHCKRRLQRLNLTNNEFEALKKAFYEKVIIGNNVFTKTNPQELERFKTFLSSGEKYDVVVDGLNVAYRMGKGAPAIASKTILSVVNCFCKDGKKVLLMGRNHMQKWPKFLKSIEKNASYFLTENLSYDDPFILYSAMNSGMKTIIVTNDLMRSHLFLLKDIKLKRLFTKWLTSNQYSVLRMDKFGKPVFQIPLPYLKTCQKEEKYWHIPCIGEDGTDNYIKHWICLKV